MYYDVKKFEYNNNKTNPGPKFHDPKVVSYKFKVMTGCKYTDNYQSQTIRELDQRT